MRKKLLPILLPLVFILTNVAQSQYSVSLIPPSLLQNANVVVRLEEKNIIIRNEGSAVIKQKYVYTVLNAGGDNHASFAKGYDKLIKVKDISGELYDENGTIIKSLKKNEIKDYSNTSESSLADDDRVKVHNFNHRIYPYTVSYECETELNGLFFLPAWVPVFDEKVAIEKSILRVETPADYNLRFRKFNYSNGPVISKLKNSQEYKWELGNFNAITEESYTPSWYEITPAVFLAPSSFEMQKYNGNMNNWEEFGLFFYKLNYNRDQLPDRIKKSVHELTDNLSTPLEKINKLYKYFQQNTRYISIQFGIGGWQTLDANFVAANGYGDCKALTNYMYALLKEAGIKSFYTLVKSGNGDHSFMQDFSSNQFNHIILCVPQKKDSIWLECTSQTLPAGYLSAFTSNRPVLMIDEKGGILTKTPIYSAQDNLQTRNINASVDAQGLLKATVNTSYRAEQQDGLQGILTGYSKEKIAEYVKTKFDLSTYEIEKFSHQESLDPLPVIKEQVSLSAKDYASVSGKRLFVNPNILSVSKFKIRNASTRKYDFEMNNPFIDYDTVLISIPDGYKMETIPPTVNFVMPLAEYSSTVKFEKGTIIYTRSYKQITGRMPASESKTIADFFEKIYKADHAKMVFIKENSN